MAWRQPKPPAGLGVSCQLGKTGMGGTFRRFSLELPRARLSPRLLAILLVHRMLERKPRDVVNSTVWSAPNIPEDFSWPASVSGAAANPPGVLSGFSGISSLHTRRGGGPGAGGGGGEAVSAEAMMTTEVAGQKRRGDGFLGCEGGGHIGCIAGGGAASSKRLKAAGYGGGVAAAARGSIPVKEKKDKIGERVTALQQLVSPYGKTDTASVLQEATGYIKFLHEQLQVLSAPYLGGNTPTGKLQEADKYSLRSRGLCLMPVASTLAIARGNGADIWAPINTHRA
ncbi:hypothetical protein Taro_016161 [Colocasia esculenta]|uniref:BHLH domain-containing protein n=1 Tax=Colocasia esculenta TaxID=4460 RepID=A0A843UPC2_COLES|nr:hypothetical protein [Colocasia esculenta]